MTGEELLVWRLQSNDTIDYHRSWPEAAPRAVVLVSGAGEYPDVWAELSWIGCADDQFLLSAIRLLHFSHRSLSLSSPFPPPQVISINKAINTQEVAVKEKHARNILTLSLLLFPFSVCGDKRLHFINGWGTL